MSKVKNGDTVKIHYTGKLKDGELFDNSRDREPLKFIVGKREVISGLENSVIGMEAGGTKTIEIPPEEAYGPRREELVGEVMKSMLPDHIEPHLGQHLQIQNPDGNLSIVTIIEVKEDTITLDANHPLAGHTLFFDLELGEIV